MTGGAKPTATRLSLQRFVVLATLGGAGLFALGAGCRNPGGARERSCAAQTQSIAADFAPLCRAWEAALHDAPPGLEEIALAPLDRPPAPTVPPGATAVLGPRFLVLGGHEIVAWGRELPLLFGQKGPPGREDEKLGSMFDFGGAARHGGGEASARRLPQIVEPPWGGLTRSKTLDERVVAHLLALRKSQRRNAGLLLLGIAADTPAGQVTAFLELVRRAGFGRVAFLFASARPPMRPASARGGASGLEAALRPWARASCGPLTSLQARLRGVAPRLRCAVAARAVREGLTVCRCSVSEAPLMTALRRMLTPPRFVAVHEVTLKPGAKPLKVEKMDEPWASLAPRVVTGPPREFRLVGPTLEIVREAGEWVGYPTPRRKRPVFKYLVEVSRSSGKGLDVADVRRVVDRHQAEVHYCYISVGLPRKPSLAGETAFSFQVAPRGQTRWVRLAQTTLKDPPTESCIRSAVLRWRFPVPEGSLPRFRIRFRLSPPTSVP